jgi:preprotein translocase subunit SecA
MIKDVKERDGERYKRIIVPFTDGSTNPLMITANIDDALESEGQSIKGDIEKTVALAISDNEWKEHLRAMDELKEASQAASFEQKDPLVVYKMEAYKLFEDLVYETNSKVTSYLLQGTLAIKPQEQSLQQARAPKRSNTSRMRTNRTGADTAERVAARAAAEGVSRRQKQETIKRTERKVGRNDLCPCGSGKKYKHCHGRG